MSMGRPLRGEHDSLEKFSRLTKWASLVPRTACFNQLSRNRRLMQKSPQFR